MEKTLFYQINHDWISDSADWVMALASSLSIWMIPLVVILSAILIFGGFKGRAFIVVLALAIALTDGLVVKTMKDAVGRVRPSQVEGTRVVKPQKVKPQILAAFQPPTVKFTNPKKVEIRGVSFPSAHTANNFAALAVLVMFFRWWGLLYLPMALLISYSRIYTGSHWPADVLFGSLLGLFLGWTAVRLSTIIYQSLAPRLVPRLYARHPSLTRKADLPAV